MARKKENQLHFKCQIVYYISRIDLSQHLHHQTHNSHINVWIFYCYAFLITDIEAERKIYQRINFVDGFFLFFNVGEKNLRIKYDIFWREDENNTYDDWAIEPLEPEDIPKAKLMGFFSFFPFKLNTCVLGSRRLVNNVFLLLLLAGFVQENYTRTHPWLKYGQNNIWPHFSF